MASVWGSCGTLTPAQILKALPSLGLLALLLSSSITNQGLTGRIDLSGFPATTMETIFE
jgi:hypothetical protein